MEKSQNRYEENNKNTEVAEAIQLPQWVEIGEQARETHDYLATSQEITGLYFDQLSPHPHYHLPANDLSWLPQDKIRECHKIQMGAREMKSTIT